MSHSTEYLQTNKANWEARVPLHLEGYPLDRFRQDPNYLSKVVQFDLPRLPDVQGLSGIHLQCHIGTDTVSLARLGASVVGLDFSPGALQAAREFAGELGLSIRFVESELYAAVESLADAGLPVAYDFVYTGIGALCWLPDIHRWAQTVAAVLKPGGFLFIREGHPMLWSLGESYGDGSLRIATDYFEGRGFYYEEETSYAGTGRLTSPGSVNFNHGLAEILNALWQHGFRVEIFEEHDSVPWNPLGDEFAPVGDTGEWRLRENPRRLAASYTLLAWKDQAPCPFATS